MVIMRTLMRRMPSSCERCDAFCYGRCVGKQIHFGKEDYEWTDKTRPSWCPLEEVECEEDADRTRSW